MYIGRKKIKPTIGSRSMVGVRIREFPLDFGNYFSFDTGHYCANMWAENLCEAIKRFNITEDLEIIEFVDGKCRPFCLVVDNRIPASWFNKKICLTGCWELTEALKEELQKANMQSQSKEE